jgi:hypothetical protein
MRQTAWLAMLAAAGLAVAAGGPSRLQAAIQDDLVVHLKFDGNTNDSSGRGNNGTSNAPLFYLPASTNSDGQTRQPFLGSGSLDLTYGEAAEYVTLATSLADLQFGTATDFTISLWTQRVISTSTPSISDPSLIGNKNWNNGNNPGWVVYADNDNWGWNYADATGVRRDFEGRALPAGEWHNITVTHDRTGLANFYHDGTFLGSRDISPLGVVDTTLATNIGQDGTGTYSPKLSHNLDDIGIWRRALNGAEVLTIVKEGRSGVDLSGITDVLVAGDVNLDGVTNQADYTVWNANVGFTTGTGSGSDDSYAKGDADFNGIVDLADFKIISDFANPPLGVPEPTSVVLVAIGFAGLGLIRKFR